MVLESVVADLLNRFLGDYVENLNKSQLKLGIWGGKREGSAGGLQALAEGPLLLAPRPGSCRGPASFSSRDSASGEGARRGPLRGRQVRGPGRSLPASVASRSGPETQAPALPLPTYLGVGGGDGVLSLPSVWPLWFHCIKIPFLLPHRVE